MAKVDMEAMEAMVAKVLRTMKNTFINTQTRKERLLRKRPFVEDGEIMQSKDQMGLMDYLEIRFSLTGQRVKEASINS